MGISEKNYKIIWGQFAGLCAICRKELIKENKRGKSSLVGEVAHIIGENKKSARGQSDSVSSHRNEHENLMLLCREHHKMIDDDEVTYTVDKLRLIKQKHIDWLRQNRSTKAWKLNISQLIYINVPRLCEQAA